MHALDPLWNPRSPPEFYSEVDGADEPELPDILVRLRKTTAREPSHLKMPVRGPMTLREVLQVNCFVQTGGVVAREFQLDVGEAVHRNQDIIVQAFTGSGKSLAMVLLLFTYPGKFIIIASPLNNLQESMCESFSKWGLISYAYNANVRTPALLQELRAKRFDVLETAPENLVEPGALRPLLTDPDWTSTCLAVAVDEGHCVIDWGLSGFRPAYARLALIRSFMAHEVPFIVVSATLAPATMAALARILHFRSGFKTINLGNIRPNIFWEVRTLDGGQKTSLRFLRFLLPPVTTAETVASIPSTIVFVPSRSMTSRVANYLRSFLPGSLAHETVLPLHAKSKPGRISRVLQCFEYGRARILVATTIAGLGRDFRNVERVIGYMPPENIEAWVQEAGRGARDDSARSLALLLIPKSIFALKKVKDEPTSSSVPEATVPELGEASQTVPIDEAVVQQPEQVDEELLSFQTAMELVEPDVYVKKLSAPMRAFIAPCDSFKPGDLCRCQILAGYFDNPVTPIDLCDVCRMRRQGNVEVLSRMPRTILDLCLPSGSSEPVDDDTPAQSARRAPPSRTKERLAAAVNKVRDWRTKEWLKGWQDTGLVLNDIVPDDVLQTVSKCLRLYTLRDLQPLLPADVFERFGQQLLDVMLDVRESEEEAEREIRERRDREKRLAAQAKAEEQARIRTEKAAERERKRAEKEAANQRARAERAASRSRNGARGRGARQGTARSPRSRSQSRAPAATADAPHVKRSGSPLDAPSPQRARVLTEATNSQPQAGPSRPRARSPSAALPPFHLPPLAGLPAPQFYLPPLPSLPRFVPNSLIAKKED